ncbi:glycolate oxidase subunit GlcE [Methylomonas sp. UP202]|uniref:glycolate oxidase subunit GlcE n=1 Tax=Methylomonas sp. UP202 TaxID=3040943 RepID=UPI0024792354|nr:glycolate oxidase subunit GlcE [Methylomonas sp. UP202]WGS88152.1 glycolate oxidase subunit GlcE [Methylomonas sp. UP202]
MTNADMSDVVVEQIRQAGAARRPLRIVGGNSKTFYGGADTADTVLSLAEHRGIIAYEPSELVITARAGTPLADINETLTEHRQMLGFEPPAFGTRATLGGTLACGFSGPRRPFAGSARDFMLGCRIVNGRAETLNFGGRVIKNVAGFDVSRLMVGALGTLGVLLEASLRVLPMPEAELTLAQSLAEDQALAAMNRLQGQSLPLSALSHHDGRLRVRLSGAETAVAAAAARIGGEILGDGPEYWHALREQALAFFAETGDLWRLSVSPAALLSALPGRQLLDWGGALRWLKTDAPAEAVHAAARAVGGHAVLWRGADKTAWLSAEPALAGLQSRLCAAFDPYGLFNPGRMPF